MSQFNKVEYEAALKTLENNRVAIFIVAYNAEKHIEKVLKRIPSWVAEKLAEIYIIDDHSPDNTFATAGKVDWSANYAPLHVYRTPYNQGYGGNQRLGYLYAIEKGFDIVVLLHGDGQYAPEALPAILAAYNNGADAVFGSRFINSHDAIKGGMPIYKWIGNRILTATQNFILGAKMSEMHSGYRSYRTSALKKIPFACNSLGFDFDADIIIQLHAAGLKIAEIPIPTFYGDEICHVNGMQYAWNCVKTSAKYKMMQFELFYDPKFDIRKVENIYTAKQAATSLHHYIRNLPLLRGSRLIDVGGGSGEAVSKYLVERGIDVTCIDQYAHGDDQLIRQISVDLDEPWEKQFKSESFDTAIALDVLEHLKTPEEGITDIYKNLKRGGKLYASTGNISFLPLRLALLIGWFNYGRRGILDLTHRRLFTVGTFKRLLNNAGFRVDKVIGFGPPISDLAGNRSSLFGIIDLISSKLAKAWPSLFAYQILIECSRTDSPADLMEGVFAYSYKQTKTSYEVPSEIAPESSGL